MQLSRAAFAVMLKYSGVLSTFEEMHLEVDAEMMIGKEETDKAETDNKISEIISKVGKFDEVFKCWVNAAKMRRWLGHKKQSLGERYKPLAEDTDQVIQEKLKTETEALELIKTKIVKKSEFLVSLQTPPIYKDQEPEEIQETLAVKKASYFATQKS